MSQMFPHRFACIVVDTPVTRQYPFKPVSQQLLHRTCLLRARIPVHIAKRRQRSLLRRPRQVVAGEKKFLPIEQRLMAARVAGRWDDEKVVIQSRLFLTFDNALYPKPNRAVRRMHYPLAAEFSG